MVLDGTHPFGNHHIQKMGQTWSETSGNSDSNADFFAQVEAGAIRTVPPLMVFSMRHGPRLGGMRGYVLCMLPLEHDFESLFGALKSSVSQQ